MKPEIEVIRFWAIAVACSILILLCWAATFRLYRTSRAIFTFD